MNDVAQRNLGISEPVLVERVIEALKALGATEASSAVITERLAEQMVRMGIHRSARVIGGTIGNASIVDGCMRRFARHLGGLREPWQDYEWSLPASPTVASLHKLKVWFRRKDLVLEAPTAI